MESIASELDPSLVTGSICANWRKTPDDGSVWQVRDGFCHATTTQGCHLREMFDYFREQEKGARSLPLMCHDYEADYEAIRAEECANRD